MSSKAADSTSASKAAESLRAKQKPLKDKYRADASSALVTLSTSGSLDPTSVTCSLNSATATATKRIAGLHAAAGGDAPDVSQELCSGDMLLESLVACFGVTVRAVATAMGMAIASGTVIAEGDLDFRGTLGVKDADGSAVNVGFQQIRLVVRLQVEGAEETEESKAQVEKLVSLSERYCVVLQTLRAGVDVQTKLGHVGKVLPDARHDRELQQDGDNSTTSVTDGAQNGSPVVDDGNVLPLN